MNLLALHDIAEERRAAWERSGARWSVVEGRPTDKPAVSLDLATSSAAGRVTVWVSGEAEMEWGSLCDGGARHYDLVDTESLRACVEDLEAVIEIR